MAQKVTSFAKSCPRESIQKKKKTKQKKKKAHNKNKDNNSSNNNTDNIVCAGAEKYSVQLYWYESTVYSSDETGGMQVFNIRNPKNKSCISSMLRQLLQNSKNN